MALRAATEGCSTQTEKSAVTERHFSRWQKNEWQKKNGGRGGQCAHGRVTSSFFCHQYFCHLWSHGDTETRRRGLELSSVSPRLRASVRALFLSGRDSPIPAPEVQRLQQASECYSSGDSSRTSVRNFSGKSVRMASMPTSRARRQLSGRSPLTITPAMKARFLLRCTAAI
jgi:hypothetical protein